MSDNYVLMVAYTNYTTDPRVIREAKAAVEAGYQVDFITLKRDADNKRENLDGVNVIRVNQSRYRGSNNLKYLLSYLEFFIRVFFVILLMYPKKRYRVVHVDNMPDFIVFTAIVPKLFGSKVILDIHDPMPSTFATKFNGDKNSLRYKLLLWEQYISAKFADEVITVHEPVKKDILVGDGIDEKKITVIANFADDDIFRYSEEYHVGEKVTLLFHGTIAERFGLQNVLMALSRIRQRNKIFFQIIGEGDYSAKIKELISEYELEDVVSFSNKFYPVKELPQIIKKFNIGMVSYEPSMATDYMLPLKMLEYISCGLPVITLRNRAIRHYFNEDDLIYYDAHDENSLLKILEYIISNPDSLYKSRNTIKQLRERFLWSSEKVRYGELLNKLCEVKIVKN